MGTARPLYILCESLPKQQGILQSMALTAGYEQYKKNDFILVFKRAQK
jgi:hypothetical protein